jgi:hypothetical protein
MIDQSTVLSTTFTSVPVMPVRNSIASHPTGITSTASALLLAAASSSPSPAIRTIRLVSSSAAANPPAFPQNVLVPPSSPFTLRFPATSTQQQLGPTSVSVDSSTSSCYEFPDGQFSCQPDWAVEIYNSYLLAVHTASTASICSSDGSQHEFDGFRYAILFFGIIPSPAF